MRHEGLLDSIGHVCKNALGMTQDVFKLFTLEAKLATRSLAVILVLCILMAFIVFTAWLALCGVLLAVLMHQQISLIGSLLLLVGLSLLFMLVLLYFIFRLFRNLRFKETLHQLNVTRHL